MKKTAPVVLIIDDNETNIGVIIEAIKDSGFEAIIARNAEMGIKRAMFSQPDLILLDVMLPDLNGFEVCRRLKAEEATRPIPIIFLTVLDRVEDKVKGFEVGAVDYLTKPIQQEEVIARVQTQLTLRQFQERLEVLVEERTTELTETNRQLQQEIFERQQAEDALRTSEQQYRLLAENIGDGIAIVQHGIILFVNRALTDMLKYPAESLIGKKSTEVFLCDRQVEHDRRIRQLLNQEITTFAWQEQCRNGDGEQMWLEMLHTRIVWQNKPAVLKTIRDITDSKRREIEIQAEHKHLKQENIVLKAEINERYKFGELIGKSRVMQEVYTLIAKAASTDAHIVIYGESGTGKECVAQTIHQKSPRQKYAVCSGQLRRYPRKPFRKRIFRFS